MKITPLKIPEIQVIQPQVFKDERGFFYESFNQNKFNLLIGRSVLFVQDNRSRSSKNVLRGLHFQTQNPQAKLIQVTHGSIFDVAVDIRKGSITFGQYIGIELSANNKMQLWIPEGFAHGFLVLSEFAEVQYKVSDYWSPESEKCLLWNDSKLNIEWPIETKPIISKKDSMGIFFDEIK